MAWTLGNNRGKGKGELLVRFSLAILLIFRVYHFIKGRLSMIPATISHELPSRIGLRYNIE